MKKMKYAIFQLMGLLALAGAFVACSEDETTPDVAPSFPELTTAVVTADECYTFTITPNTAWSLSLSDESVAYYSFQHNGTTAYRLHGEEGTHQITVQVAPFDEFDTDRTGEVLLTLGTGALQETRTIVKLTRKALERDLAIYLAEYDATATDPDYVRDEEGALLYATTPAESFEFHYDTYNYTYQQRLAVDANFEWHFMELPAWFSSNEVVSGTEGRTELFVRVNSTAHPFTDTTAELGFLDLSNENNPVEVATKVSVTLPGCEAFCVVERIASEVLFDRNGAFDNNGSLVETGLIGSLSAPLGARLYVAAKVGDKYSFAEEDTAWVTLTEVLPEGASTEYGIWSRDLTITVAASEVAPREAVLVAVPQTVAKTLTAPEELLTEEKTAFKEASYVVSTFKQASGLPEDFVAIEPVDPNDLRGWGSTFAPLEKGTWPWMNSWSEIPYAYGLTHKTVDAITDLFIHLDYASYRIFGFDGPDEEYTDLASCWIALEEGSQPGSKRVRMRLGEEYTDANGVKQTYTNPLAGDGGENEATIVFYAADGTPLTMLYCQLTSGSTPTPDPDSGAVSFVDPTAAAAAGVYLKPVVEGDADYRAELAGMGVPHYYVIFTKPAAVALQVPEYIYPMSYDTSWLNCEQTAETVVTLTATQTTAGKKTAVSLYASMGLLESIEGAHFTCVYDPEYSESDEPSYDPNGAVTFLDKEAADAMGATLYAMPTTDDDYSYNLEFAGVPQYILTLKKAGSITLKVPAYFFGWQYSSASGNWLSFSPDWVENTTEVTITMTSTGKAEQVTFLSLYTSAAMDESSQAAQIKCILTNEE